MRLPYRNTAIIPREKLTKYLLSEAHPVGRSKAKFFRQLGFDEQNVGKLEQSLFAIVENNDIKKITSLPYGKNYQIDGAMLTPRGKTVIVTTIWFIRTGRRNPSFVTAYPV